MEYYTRLHTPVGQLLLTAGEESLTGLYIDGMPKGFCLEAYHRQDDHAVFQQASQWLDGYFAGKPGPVSLPLNPKGTPFQQQVWKILREIPWGETRTYGAIAREMAEILGKQRMSAQAVGGAVGKNPISILIPCHRVLGAQGQLTGYAWGLEKKQWLLRQEGLDLKKDGGFVHFASL